MNTRLKSYELKQAELSGNMLKGAAAVMGNLDRVNDCIFPGAFKSALKSFRESGFVSVGHDWHDLPVAMPTFCAEQGNKLYSEAEFHSTSDAQEARTICIERIANGFTVGLSVGFDLDWNNGLVQFQNGAKLLQYATDNGYDLALFDEKGIRACKDTCWGIIKISDLFEYSIVPVPMNPDACITEVKSINTFTERDFERLLREAGCSRKRAVAITLHGWKADAGKPDDQRDAEMDGKSQSEAEPLQAVMIDVGLLRSRALALTLSIGAS